MDKRQIYNTKIDIVYIIRTNTRVEMWDNYLYLFPLSFIELKLPYLK